MTRGSEFGDYLEFLRELGASGAAYFLEGGQAVNFWAEYFSARGAAVAMDPFRPFTSKDCDLWVSYAALQYLESKTGGGRMIKGRSPADGQIGIFALDGPEALRVDLLSHVYGIPQDRIPRLLDRVLEVSGIRVIDPILLFQSKCHCLLGLDQTDRQDEKHLRILHRVLPEHFDEVLEDVRSGFGTERALINEIKLLLGILKTQRVRRALSLIGLDPKGLVRWEKFTVCGLTKVERFTSTAAGGNGGL